MAVRLESTIKRFIGLSTDEKPYVGQMVSGAVLQSTDLPPGSSFMETDTGRISRFSGTEWTHPVAQDVSEIQAEILIHVLDLKERFDLLLS